MQRTRIDSTDNPLFNEAWELYQDAFPSKERRDLAYQKTTMMLPEYHFEIVHNNQQLIGIICWWNFSDVRYIEHFATVATLRGKGKGAEIVKTFCSESDTPIILEVELPEDELTKRRIKFYERLGFAYNSHFYSHTPYSENGERVILSLMSYPNGISESDVKQFSSTHHPIIHFR